MRPEQRVVLWHYNVAEGAICQLKLNSTIEEDKQLQGMS